MHISPTFGKAVYVNGSADSAQKIVDLVNSKKVKSSERELQAQAKSIFDDTTEKGQAIVCSFDNGDVYILSGEETKQVKRLNAAHRRRVVALNKNSKNMELDIEAYNKNFNKFLHKFILENESPFDLSFEMNKSKTKIKTLIQDWVKVFAVVGTPIQLENMTNTLNSSEGKVSIHNATSLYIGNNSKSQYTNAVQQGKKVAFLVTGKEATDNIEYMKYGWTSLLFISKKIERFISLSDDNKKNIVPVLEAMKH